MSKNRFAGRTLFVVCCIVLFTFPSTADPAETPKKYALLVGVNEYDHGNLSKLDWAVNDAAELRNVLTRAGYAVVLLTAEEARARMDNSLKPTCGNIQMQLKKLVRKFARGDTLLIGLAGHGLQFEGDEDGYFCPVDARPFKGRTETLVSIKWIYDRLKEDAASGVKLLLVDACRNLIAKGSRGINAGNTPPPPDGVGVLLSCKAGQTARERDDYKHGVFFYHVLEGLKGKATDEEGSVTWDSLRAYVKKKVSRAEDNQTPEEAGRLAGAPPVLVAASGSGGPEHLVVPLKRGGKLVLEFVRIPKGRFRMGSPQSERDDLKKRYAYDPHDEEEHEVEITRDYWLCKTTVTRGQFRAFVEDSGYQTEGERDGKGGYGWTGVTWEQKPEFTWKKAGFEQTDDHPVLNVSWNDARAFCDWVKGKTARSVRLPTEAEWEGACRGGQRQGRFFFGDNEEDLAPHANVRDASFRAATKLKDGIEADDGYAFTAPVAKFRPNQYGLYDMHGNVWQWCQDWYGKQYYVTGEKKDPQGPPNGTQRVLRGGAWSYNARDCRAAVRASVLPTHRHGVIGFRLALRLD